MTTKLVTLALAILFIACGPTKTGNETNDQAAIEAAATMDKAPAFSPLVAAYLELKDALVLTSTEKASVAAEKIASIVAVPASPLEEQIKADAASISQATDVASQRAQFVTLSENVYQLVKLNANETQTLYQQFCPMANESKGAFWLSTSEEIQNPYYGSAMLKCGSVKEKI